MGKTKDLFKKISDTKGIFHTKMGTIKDRNGMDLIKGEDIKKRWQEYTELVLGCNFKNNRKISVCFQGKPFNITVIQVSAPTTNAKEAEVERFCEDLQIFQNTKKFIVADCNAEVRSQVIPGVASKFGLGMQNEAEQRLTEFCQENALVIPNTPFQQHRR